MATTPRRPAKRASRASSTKPAVALSGIPGSHRRRGVTMCRHLRPARLTRCWESTPARRFRISQWSPVHWTTARGSISWFRPLRASRRSPAPRIGLPWTPRAAPRAISLSPSPIRSGNSTRATRSMPRPPSPRMARFIWRIRTVTSMRSIPTARKSGFMS